MNWVKIRRLMYLPGMAACLLSAAILAFLFRSQPVALLLIGVGLLVPGLVARRLLSALLEGRLKFARKDYAGSIEATEQFLTQHQHKPWIRHTIWGAFGIDTLDVAAMAHNNVGASLLMLGRLDESVRSLQTARALDPKYPMPVFNLAMASLLQGDHTSANALGKLAYELGYPGTNLDAVLSAIGAGYAAVPR